MGVQKINQAAIDFIAEVGAALGVDPQTTEGVAEIAVRTGAQKRYLYRWRVGTNAPSLRNVVSMLRSANLLRSPGEAAGEPESPHSILSKLGDAVATLSESHREALADLDDVRIRLERAEEALIPARGDRGKKSA